MEVDEKDSIILPEEEFLPVKKTRENIGSTRPASQVSEGDQNNQRLKQLPKNGQKIADFPENRSLFSSLTRSNSPSFNEQPQPNKTEKSNLEILKQFPPNGEWASDSLDVKKTKRGPRREEELYQGEKAPEEASDGHQKIFYVYTENTKEIEIHFDDIRKHTSLFEKKEQTKENEGNKSEETKTLDNESPEGHELKLKNQIAMQIKEQKNKIKEPELNPSFIPGEKPYGKAASSSKTTSSPINFRDDLVPKKTNLKVPVKAIKTEKPLKNCESQISPKKEPKTKNFVNFYSQTQKNKTLGLASPFKHYQPSHSKKNKETLSVSPLAHFSMAGKTKLSIGVHENIQNSKASRTHSQMTQPKPITSSFLTPKSKRQPQTFDFMPIRSEKGKKQGALSERPSHLFTKMNRDQTTQSKERPKMTSPNNKKVHGQGSHSTKELRSRAPVFEMDSTGKKQKEGISSRSGSQDKSTLNQINKGNTQAPTKIQKGFQSKKENNGVSGVKSAKNLFAFEHFGNDFALFKERKNSENCKREAKLDTSMDDKRRVYSPAPRKREEFFEKMAIGLSNMRKRKQEKTKGDDFLEKLNEEIEKRGLGGPRKPSFECLLAGSANSPKRSVGQTQKMLMNNFLSSKRTTSSQSNEKLRK